MYTPETAIDDPAIRCTRNKVHEKHAAADD